MSDPTKLDYFNPKPDGERPKSRPFHRGVGFVGFLIYGTIAFLFDTTVVMGVLSGKPLPLVETEERSPRVI